MGMKSTAPFLVCFGDSLTAGYQTGVGGFGLTADSPYGGFIQQWVGGGAKIVVTGICGELTSEMVQRFHRDVVAVEPKITVILGGTNDLGSGVSPMHIFENLQPGMGQKDSERPIPPWVQPHIDQRLILNQQISEACRTFNIQCLDLFAETLEGPTHLLASQFASDGLHFTTAGYEVFARLVWRRLLAEPFGDCPP